MSSSSSSSSSSSGGDEQRPRRFSADELRARVHPMTLECSSRSSIDAFCDALVARFGDDDTRGIAVLVNNAGTLDATGGADARWGVSLFDTPLDEFERVFAVNVWAVLQLTQRLLPGMLRRRHGRVVNVGSRAGLVNTRTVSGAGESAYKLSKCAVHHVTRLAASLADDAGADDVCVNAVTPGFVQTAMTATSPLHAKLVARTPAHGAETIAWLATWPRNFAATQRATESDDEQRAALRFNGCFWADKQRIDW